MAQRTHTEFEDRWHTAPRYHDDLGAAVDLVPEAYATDDPPSWMDEECRRLRDRIASAPDDDPDDEDSPSTGADEQNLLFDDLRACEDLMTAGREALRVPANA